MIDPLEQVDELREQVDALNKEIEAHTATLAAQNTEMEQYLINKHPWAQKLIEREVRKAQDMVHAYYITRPRDEEIAEAVQAERQRLLELIGEDERRCQHYVTGEHNVFGGKRCHTSADQRNHLRAELRSALLSEEDV